MKRRGRSEDGFTTEGGYYCSICETHHWDYEVEDGRCPMCGLMLVDLEAEFVRFQRVKVVDAGIYAGCIVKILRPEWRSDGEEAYKCYVEEDRDFQVFLRKFLTPLQPEDL